GERPTSCESRQSIVHHVHARGPTAAASVPDLRSSPRLSAYGDRRRQADRALGLFQLSSVRSVRLSRPDADTSPGGLNAKKGVVSFASHACQSAIMCCLEQSRMLRTVYAHAVLHQFI